MDDEKKNEPVTEAPAEPEVQKPEEAVPEQAAPEAAPQPEDMPAEAETSEEQTAAQSGEEAEEEPVFDLDTILDEYHDQADKDDTTNLSDLLDTLAQELPDVAPPQEPEEAEPEAPPEEETRRTPIVFGPGSELSRLKKALVAGPEKRFYDLSEKGVLKLQIGILLNALIVLLCIGTTTLAVLDKVPTNRMKLLLFSQILAMLVSAALGSHLLIDGIDDLFHLKFSMNTAMTLTLLACCADAYFCVQELRVPCCAAFALEMTMAMVARFHKRSIEMSQMDTLRKATRLTGLVKEPDYYDGRPGILRTQADVEDYMETYAAPTGPEKAQRILTFLSFMLCVAIAAVAGILHSVSMGVQIFAVSLLCAIPASAFTALTHPTAVLEKRLHLVGSVICGWRGVKKLCGKAVFPLTDNDLFPKGATKVNGIKFYSDHDPDRVVAYAASLIFAAGGGLVGVFRGLMNGRSYREFPVENFRDYGGGGIGGEILEEPVLVGNLKFLQDMGVEIPTGTMVNQAVYVAIDGQLAAVIAISYSRMRSSAAGLVSLCARRKIKPVLLAGDFMLTEDFIRSKFSVRPSKVAMPPKEVRAELLQKRPAEDAEVLALVTREDLVSSAYAVCGAMSLRTACRLGVWIQVISGGLALLTMLALAYLGSVELLTPTNVLAYQIIWLVPGFLASKWTKHV